MANNKTAFITGITGQDGSYLAELLLDKGYTVHGVIRRSSSFNTQRIEHLYQDPHEPSRRLHLHYGDLTDSSNLSRLIETIEPDEIYNLGAQSHVAVSFQVPEYTAEVDGLGTLRLLDAIKETVLKTDSIKPRRRSFMERFRKHLNRRPPFYPQAVCRRQTYAYWLVVNYREAYDMFAVNGILFNHESPRRGKTFVTRKITRAAARIACGLQDKLYLGNMDAKRDWGFAPEYVEAMWRMLQADEPDDFVIATGETHTVREFAGRAFERAGIELAWEGEGVNEIGRSKASGKVLVEVDPRYFRPTEVELLLGDPTKAENKLGWKPETLFEDLVGIMVDADMEDARKEQTLKEAGFSVASSSHE